MTNTCEFVVDVKIQIRWQKPPKSDVDAMGRNTSQVIFDSYARRLANKIEGWLNEKEGK